MNTKRLFVFLLCSCRILSLEAQQSLRYTDTYVDEKKAVDEMGMHHYQQAYNHLRQDVYKTGLHQREGISVDRQTAMYEEYLCALKLNKPHAVEQLQQFLNETPYTSLRQSGLTQLGAYYFEHNQFEQAIKSYEAGGIRVLNNAELIKRNFELGYSYLVTQQLDKVEPFFQSAKQIPGDYFKPGNYYHGLLSYYKKDYKAARESFMAVKDDERYKKIIPFYLTEIDYMTGDKDKALTEALEYLNAKDKLEYDRELNQMVAQIYCEKEAYADASNYYKTFIQQDGPVRNEDYFKLGYCLYQQSKWEDALTYFEKIEASDSLFNKHGIYFSALCYLKLNDKVNATKNLQRLKAGDLNAQQQEEVAMNLVRLSYEDEDASKAIQQVKDFLVNFPSSGYNEEARELLIALYTDQHQFDEALQEMNLMTHLSFGLQKLYQQLTYARGLDQLKSSQALQAAELLTQSKKYPADRSLVSMADFWLAESHYRAGKLDDALTDADFFLHLADTTSMPELTHKVHLMRSYVFKQYKDTIKLIQEYQLATGNTDSAAAFTSMDSIKPLFMPVAYTNISHDTLLLTYHLSEEKIDFVYQPIPLKPLAMQTAIRREDQTNFVKAAAGNFSTLDIAAGYNVDDLINHPLYVEAGYQNTTGSLGKQSMRAMNLGVYSTTEIEEHAVDLALSIDRKRLNNYGYDHTLYNYDNTDIRQIYQQTVLAASVQPLHKNRYDIHYQADLSTGIYNERNRAAEVSVKLDLPISKQYKPDVNVQASWLIDGNIFSSKGYSAQGNSLIEWKPSVTKQLEQLSIKAGLYPAIGQKVYLLPDIALSYPVYKQLATAQAGFYSTVKMNTYRELSSQNPFMYDHYTVNQSRYSEVSGGLHGNVTANLSYSAKVGLAQYEQLPLFVNDTSTDNKQFNVVYDQRARLFVLDASARYTIHQDMQAGISFSYHPVVHLNNQQAAWHYVAAQTNVFARASIFKGCIVKADLFMMNGSKAALKSPVDGQLLIKTLPAAFDLNLSAQYAFLKNWHATLDVNNLLGSHYQRWYGYPMLGTNLRAGCVYTFRNNVLHQYIHR